MFTPKKIAKAFENLFELFDEDILSALNENYHEEIDAHPLSVILNSCSPL